MFIEYIVNFLIFLQSIFQFHTKMVVLKVNDIFLIYRIIVWHVLRRDLVAVVLLGRDSDTRLPQQCDLNTRISRSYLSPNYPRASRNLRSDCSRTNVTHSGTQRVTPSPNYLDSDHSGLIIPTPFYRCSVRRYGNGT